MKRIRATMSILTLAAASSLMTDALAANCDAVYGKTERAPFLIGFETSGNGTVVEPVIYLFDTKSMKVVKALDLDDKDKEMLLKGALTVNGQRCGHRAIAVNRFWNHDLFYTIEIAPGVYIKIMIPH